MKINFHEFIIEISDEPYYSMASADNFVFYGKEYFNGVLNSERVDPVSKHGIRVWKNDEELSSVIIGEKGGATTIHEHSFLIAEDHLLLCCGFKVYAFNLPYLNLDWAKRLDPSTCLSIYAFDNGFIIHGELSITKIDKHGNEQWEFGARDIFITQDGSTSIAIHSDRIELKDWEGYKYILDKNGIEIQ